MDSNERKANSRSHSITMNRDSKFILRKIVMDFVILFCIGFCILVFYLWGLPYQRGFFCDDDSLRHPYKDSTVTNIMLYVVGLGLPILTMCLTEWLRLRDYKSGRPREIFGKEIPAWVWEAYQVIGVFLFGVACQQLTTDIAKYTIGRLRPHFFDVCRPNVDCDAAVNKWRYITDFKCLGDNEKLLKEMRLSFPSGHSSFSAYTMLYFAFYIHKRFTWRGSKLLRHGLQFVLVMLAWYTVMTRVSDYKHHWSDVMAGFSVGLLYAVIVFTFVSNLRKTPRIRQPINHHDSELHATNGNGTGWRV
ncbi:putative phosphatidate phosphatase [Choristoneura fumiferana]|uniref:putative phosphatidate phosphatase n=1 Tax=Choristoneura fumiferana TaxID=7141 RepID=UPI003D153D9F